MKELLHAAGRGAVAAMAMTGMRAFTVHYGFVLNEGRRRPQERESPP